MRFRPEQHLRRQNDIRAVRDRGSRMDARAFTIWSLRRDVGERPRVGVIASKSAVGAAVQRNLAKRRLREIFRRQQQLVPPRFDLLLIARAAVNRWPFAELENRFIEACRKMGALKPND